MSKPDQLTRADLDKMTHEEVGALEKTGQLDKLLRKPEQLSRADLGRMTPEQIVQAKKAGQLDDVLGVTVAFYPPAEGTQWTAADVEEARAVGADEKIADARQRGDLNQLMGVQE